MKVVIFSITLALFVSFASAQTAATPQQVVLLDTALIIDNTPPQRMFDIDTVEYFAPKSKPINTPMMPSRTAIHRPKGGELWKLIRILFIEKR